MSYCRKCGKDIKDAAFCPFCGASQREGMNPGVPVRSHQNYQNYSNDQGYGNAGQNASATPDSGSMGWAVLGFCIPLAGLIIWLVWNSSHPQNAKKAGTGALVSVILSIIMYVLIAVAGIGTAFML